LRPVRLLKNELFPLLGLPTSAIVNDARMNKSANLPLYGCLCSVKGRNTDIIPESVSYGCLAQQCYIAGYHLILLLAFGTVGYYIHISTQWCPVVTEPPVPTGIYVYR